MNNKRTIIILSLLSIILTLIIIVILNINIYFDICWDNNICQIDTKKVIDLIKDDYFNK